MVTRTSRWRGAALAGVAAVLAACSAPPRAPGSADGTSLAPPDDPTDASAPADDAAKPAADASQGAAACTRASDPYLMKGDAFPTCDTWAGIAAGDTAPSTLRATSLRDADGSHGIHAVYLTEASFLCAACVGEAKWLRAQLAQGGSWYGLGVEVVQLVWTDVEGAPANIQAAAAWKQAVGATWTVVADPDFTLRVQGSNPMPVHILVDPRTMTVVGRGTGFEPTGPDAAQVEALARANANR